MHFTFVLLLNLVPDKVQKNEGSLVRVLEEIITYGFEEEEADINLESVMEEENDYFELLLDDTPVARRQEDLHEESTKNLDG